MIKCHNCNQTTRDDLDKCQYCNTVLPKRGVKEFFIGLLKPLIRPEVLDQLNGKKTEEPQGVEQKARSDFRMVVDDVFFITGRGTIVTGKIEIGSIRVGETITLTAKSGQTRYSKVIGIEMFRKILQ